MRRLNRCTGKVQAVNTYNIYNMHIYGYIFKKVDILISISFDREQWIWALSRASISLKNLMNYWDKEVKGFIRVFDDAGEGKGGQIQQMRKSTE